MAVVLFTDLVGSTELRGRLGEEAADDLRRKHDQLLAQAVESNNGRVVKSLGDGIMAAFAGAADAVAAAVAIQQAVDRFNRSGKTPVPLAVRVGLSAGDVSFEHDDVHGTPVVEASRLCAAAAGGEILASEIVRWLGSAQGAHSLTPVGSLELKGLAAPVPAVRVGWEPLPVSTIPMPALLTDVGRIFVGRDAELERLIQLWKEASAGERRVALLAGEPGVGKTRLAAQLATGVHEEGGIVLAGRCDEDLGVPYQPFVEALRHFVDHTPSADLKERLGRYGGELGRLVPELAERLPDLPPPLRSDPETERYRLFDAVGSWLTVASAEEPLVLVLDDLHWAAKPTLMLLRHVVGVGSGRVLVLGIYRDTELTYDHPLVGVLADLRRLGGVERFSLSGLDDVGVRTLVEQAAGGTLDQEGLALARAVYQETEGNPFFVREVLRHLAETGAVERGEGRWTTRIPVDQLGIPEGVREVVGHRLSRLSADTNRTLRVAAVVGPEFELDVVQTAGNLSEEALLGACEEAAGARLVIEVSGTCFRFAHALVRATLYESLTAARKIALHRKVAEAIETRHQGALDDYLPALAHHWARAAAPSADTARAVEYATRAGDRALAQLAHDEAVSYYRQALDLLSAGNGPTDEARRLELLIALGEAQRRAGDTAHRETLLGAAELALGRGDPSALARAALANTRGAHASVAGKTDDERIRVLEAALDAIPDADSETRARLLATLGLELTWAADRDRRVRLSDDALAMARRLGHPGTLARVLLARFVTIWGPGTLTERLANCDELITVAQRLKDPAITSRAWWLRFRALTEMGHIDEAASCLEVAERLMADLDQPSLRWLATMSRGGLALLKGQADEADRLFRESFEIGKASEPDAINWYTQQAFEVLLEQDRVRDLDPQLQEVLRTRTYFREIQAVLTVFYCESGRLDDARRLLRQFADHGFTTVPVDPVWPRAMTLFADAAVRLADIDAATSLYDLISSYPDQFPVVTGVITGSNAHFLGVLATILRRFDNAEAHFAHADALHSQVGSPIWVARTHLEWARMLLARGQQGDAERAQELLGQALATARELGLANVERRAVELLS